MISLYLSQVKSFLVVLEKLGRTYGFVATRLLCLDFGLGSSSWLPFVSRPPGGWLVEAAGTGASGIGFYVMRMLHSDPW